ncbi:MAG: DUF5916 domain-containing protein [Vicinamibacterales bacterium]
MVALAACAGAAPAGAQSPPLPPPVPSLVERRAADDVTVRAVRLDAPLTLDGRLDEPIYTAVAPLTDFIQQEPNEGAPATEKTEAWVLFDDDSLYVVARCWESRPDREVANELRRDGNILGNDNLTFVIDTFHDRRNGYLFQTNPLGGLRDMTITDDQQNQSWNGIWYVKTGRFAEGWTVEVRIPFKTLRYRGDGPQTWGINLRRLVKWKNEFSYLSLVPAALGTGGVSRMASAATMTGLETPAASKNLEVKPYALASSTTNRAAAVPFTNRADGNAGVDVKLGLTRSIILDATVRTDFAQVEEDLQQVNLTRFNLFFPEKREFFIEGQGIFDFGGVQAGNSPGDVPLLFFSRQIGLSQGRAVPVLGGGRVTGRAGAYSLGALHIVTDDAPEAGAVSTAFSALRLKRNVLRRSNVGVLATRRAPAAGPAGSAGLAPRDPGYTIGADATFLFGTAVGLTGYYARTAAPGPDGRSRQGVSYRGRVDYNADRYGASAEHMLVGREFQPEVGYVRRADVRRSLGQVRFSPRPKRSRRVRKYTYQASLDYVTDAATDVVQSREASGTFRADFQSSDQFTAEVSREYERLPARFGIAPGVSVPAGGYTFSTARVTYSLGQQRTFAGRLSASTGSLYGGTKHEITYGGRWGLASRFAVEPAATLDWVRLPYGDFEARLLSTRFTVTPSARMQIGSLVQMNVDARTLSASLRLRWEYTGGSDLFVVYSDGRDTGTRGIPDLLNRTFAVKVTRLFRF